MATFAENIRKIRGEAIYGPDVRTAIAEALTQYSEDVDNMVYSVRQEFDTKLSNQTFRVNRIQKDINERDLFIKCESIENDDYKVNVLNAV